MAVGALRPRWGQPLTGIISLAVFSVIAWITWFIFSDPRGPIGWFPYPFVMYLAMIILVGLWQHMFLGDWPFQKMKQPLRGILMSRRRISSIWRTYSLKLCDDTPNYQIIPQIKPSKTLFRIIFEISQYLK